MRVSATLVGAVAVMMLLSLLITGASVSTAAAITGPGCPRVGAPTLYQSDFVAGHGRGCGGHNTMYVKSKSPSGTIRLLKICDRTLSRARMWCPTGARCRTWLRYRAAIFVLVQGRQWRQRSAWVTLC